MNILLIILFALTLVMTSLIVLGVNVSEKSFKMVVLLILLLLIANALDWIHWVTK